MMFIKYCVKHYLVQWYNDTVVEMLPYPIHEWMKVGYFLMSTGIAGNF